MIKYFLKLTLNNEPIIKWARDTDRPSTRENIQMANKHMKRSQKKIKVLVRNHYTPITITKNNCLNSDNVLQFLLERV